MAGASTVGREGLLVLGCEVGKIVRRFLFQHRYSEGTSTAERDPGLDVLGFVLGLLGRLGRVGREVLSADPYVSDLRLDDGGFYIVFVVPHLSLAGLGFLS